MIQRQTQFMVLDVSIQQEILLTIIIKRFNNREPKQGQIYNKGRCV